MKARRSSLASAAGLGAAWPSLAVALSLRRRSSERARERAALRRALEADPRFQVATLSLTSRGVFAQTGVKSVTVKSPKFTYDPADSTGFEDFSVLIT